MAPLHRGHGFPDDETWPQQNLAGGEGGECRDTAGKTLLLGLSDRRVFTVRRHPTVGVCVRACVYERQTTGQLCDLAAAAAYNVGILHGCWFKSRLFHF